LEGGVKGAWGGGVLNILGKIRQISPPEKVKMNIPLP
jgi:hypothetical protein